jgi:hypothetical protein
MRKLRVGIIDLVAKAPTRALYARVMNANFASIMPQVVAVWCEEQGHDVTLVCYTGFENLVKQLPYNVDLVFIGAFTEAAQLAYALSNQFQTNGAVTVLGGPHARCYPHDAQRYFDYVLGFTDKTVICDVLNDCSQHRPIGVHLDTGQQPVSLPGVRERWKFIEPTLRKAPLIKIVPMLGSLGCPYTCGFCIDSAVTYQPLDFDVMKEDLRFLLQTIKRPLVGWHDPNFGVRFDDCMNAIEEVVPPDSIDFVAESSLSLLGEENLKRLKRNGFKAMLPGIESWFDLGNKSKTGSSKGMDKVRQVSEHVNMIMRYLPYVQANFVLGLDDEKGPEPFELTKRFVDLSPGVLPAYSLLSAFGQAATFNLEFQRDSRVIPFPFHFLNNNQAMNIRPKNYSWPGFYDHVIDLTSYSFSWRAIANRLKANRTRIPRLLNLVRAISSEGFGRIKYYKEIRRRLDEDMPFRRFFEQETTEIPQFYVEQIRQELGPMWAWLPQGALHHDPNAYLKGDQLQSLIPMNGRAKGKAEVAAVPPNHL